MATVVFSGYLALTYNNKFRPGTMRLTKNKPSLKKGEIPLALRIVLPESLLTIPTLMANVEIPDNTTLSSTIDAEVQDNISEIIKDTLGVNVHITLEKEDEDD